MLIIITHTLLSLLFPLLIGYSLYRVFRGHSSKKLPLKSGENLPSGKTVIGSAEGENYYYQYQAERRPGGRGRRGELAVLRVWVKTSQGGSFIAQAEEKGSFMLPPRVSTGAQEFDSKYAIYSDAPHYTRSALQDELKQAALRRILERKFDQIEQDGEMLKALWSPFPDNEPFDLSLIQETGKDLILLSKGLPTMHESVQAKVEEIQFRRARPILIGFLLLVFAGTTFDAYKKGSSLQETLLLNLLLTLSFYWLIWWGTKKRWFQWKG